MIILFYSWVDYTRVSRISFQVFTPLRRRFHGCGCHRYRAVLRGAMIEYSVRCGPLVTGEDRLHCHLSITGDRCILHNRHVRIALDHFLSHAGHSRWRVAGKVARRRARGSSGSWYPTIGSAREPRKIRKSVTWAALVGETGARGTMTRDGNLTYNRVAHGAPLYRLSDHENDSPVTSVTVSDHN